MKRPTINDPEIIRAAAVKMLPDVRHWLGNDLSSDEELLKDLCRAMVHSDGYKIARALDDWEPDAYFVDIMDATICHKMDALDAAIKAMETNL